MAPWGTLFTQVYAANGGGNSTGSTGGTGAIASRAMLVDLTISLWTATRHDKRITAEVAAAHGSDASMGRYAKHLVAKEALEHLHRVAADASAEHRRRTLPWLDTGARILSSAGYFDYAQAMRAFNDLWDDAVAAFIREYPTYLAGARQRLNSLYQDDDYPAPSQIGGKFAFGYNVIPIPTASDFRVDLGDVETERIRGEIEATMITAVDTAMREVATRVRDVVGHMAERLRAYHVSAEGVTAPFRDSLVENVRELAALIPTLNLTGDAALAEIGRRMESELCHFSAGTLRASTEARKSTAQAAETILDKMYDFLA